jgi:AraC-like DNA-binding protein
VTSAALLFAIDIANIVCCVLLGARVLAMRARSANTQLLALILFNTVCHFLLSRYEYRYWIPVAYQFDLSRAESILDFFRNLTPGLFMFLCFRMFADAPRFPRWLLALFLFETCLEAVIFGKALGPQASPIITHIVPGVLQGLFAASAIYFTFAGWGVDLMESRRHARAIVAAVIGLNIIASTLLLRVLIPFNSAANYHTYVALMISNLLIGMFILIFSGDGDVEAPLGVAAGVAERGPVPEPLPSPEVATVLIQLARVMETERVYQQPSLSVKELADLVGAPEYRLRKIIHEQLGYQNFNAFLHDYRIRDACQQLRDPKMQRIPILTIALSIGYQSINTFNRGFRDILGMTPSAYRSLTEPPIPSGPKKISPKTP